MKIMLVAGARPNFMKIAPVYHALRAHHLTPVIVHTGQHYDFQMSDTFFRDLGLPAPDHFLRVGSGTHAVQTARILEAFEPVLLQEKPHWVIVAGDVNSTLGCALVTAKLKYDFGCRIAHLEAGLRSHDWRMPEEVNRVLTDRLSDLLLTPSRDAEPNLIAEGIAPARIRFVGNVMIDTLFAHLPAAEKLKTWDRLGVAPRNYAVATLHRPSNVDDPIALRDVLEGLVSVSSTVKVVMPLHPRTQQSAKAAGLSELLGRLIIVDPLSYLDMLALNSEAAIVLTDSGGLQEETTALGVPCVTLREQTERPITISEGTNRLAPWPLTPDGIRESALIALASDRYKPGARVPEGWDGRAAHRVVEAIKTAPSI